MSAKFVRALIATGALVGISAAWGCVTDRPSRNGVFNENQYMRKDFLVRPGDGSKPDSGWMMKATVVQASTPNPLGSLGMGVGSENGGALVRFGVTQDKLQIINMRELNNDPAVQSQLSREPEVMNAWPVTNVDLKYRINLDGEKTNFYEENQELDWKLRQWVKINFAKNDMSDVAALGAFQAFYMNQCTDASNSSATLVPDSLRVDEANDYFQWKVQVTVPVKTGDAACDALFDAQALELFGKSGGGGTGGGRSNVSFTVMYSFNRAVAPDKITYQPLVMAEKDPIRRKYGTIDLNSMARDLDTGLIAGRALSLRYDPNKDIVWYFAPGYPENYKAVFTDPNTGIAVQTNAVLKAAGATGKVVVKNFDQDLQPGQPPREYGDVRYNFIRWMNDIDGGQGRTLAVTQFVPDPRTGEILSSSVNVYGFELKDRILEHLDFYLSEVGAAAQIDPTTGEWPDGPANCQDGDVMPIVPDVVVKQHNADSTVYGKMQTYLQRPIATYGKLQPSDFIVPQDADFFHAYYSIVPYQIYADPAANFWTTWEGGNGTYAPTGQAAANQYALAGKVAEFNQIAAQMSQGWIPYDMNTSTMGYQNAAAFLNHFQDLTIAHRDLEYSKNFMHGLARYDDSGMYSYLGGFQRDARHCISGAWETRADYVKHVVESYHSLTVWHEFGHTLGLDHNFMASLDRPNFPHYADGAGRDHVGMYQSSVMEYNANIDRVFWTNETGMPAGNGKGQYGGWGPYDRGAIGFLYANNHTATTSGPQGARGPGLSGQIDAQHPWNDPTGFDATGKETQFLYCNANHLKYTPFCRQFDFGTTPSEIIAQQIDDYEWNYKFTNFRLYHKIWNKTNYAAFPTNMVTELRRFLTVWQYDWSAAEITDTLRRLGVTPPAGAPAATYYENLTSKFEKDISVANQLVASWHKAIIQQSSGERPFRTLYDNYYGDVTQQGIILDKVLALQSWVALWKSDNFDPLQAQGGYMSSYSEFGDGAYETVAEDAVDSMIGGQYDIFPFGKPLAVVQFAQATHDVNFGGRIEIRDWVGGKVFGRERDFLDWVRQAAIAQHQYGCTSLDNCTWDPRTNRVPGDLTSVCGTGDLCHSDQFNEFQGPDGRRYSWAYVADRNTWAIVDRDRNTASYLILRAYNADIKFAEDDGSYGAYFYQLPIKYFLDSYNQYN